MAYITIPNETTRLTFSVVGATSAFPFSFAVFAKTDLNVTVGGVALGQTDFTLTGTLLQGGGYQGGTVTLNTPVSATTVVIWRTTVPQRVTNFAPASYVSVRDLDTQFNLLTAMAADNRRDIVSASSVAASASAASISAALANLSAFSAAASAALPGLSGTSATSLTIGTGGKVFTMDAGKSIATGALILVSDSTNNANYMHGAVTGYDPATGIMSLNVLDTKGSGTKSSWNISGSGPQGTSGAGSGDMLAANNLSDVNAVSARANLAVPGLATTNTFAAAQTLSVGGTVTQAAGVSAREIGYAGVPQIIKSAGFTTTAVGLRCEYYCNATLAAVIDSNANVAVGVGDFYVFSVDAGHTLTLSITADTMLDLAANRTGTRTVAGPATAVVSKKTSTTWWLTYVGGTVT